MGGEMETYLNDEGKNITQAKLLNWFNTSLSRETIKLAKKHEKIKQNELLILNAPISNSDNDSEELLDVIQLSQNILEATVCENLMVKKILSVLTERQRIVTILNIIYGYSESEIAKMLNVSQPSVHKTKARAVEKISIFCEKEGDII